MTVAKEPNTTEKGAKARKRLLRWLQGISIALLVLALGAFVVGSCTIRDLSTDGSHRLSAKHFKDFPALISKLRNPQDPISSNILSRFSTNVIAVLTNTVHTPAHLESFAIQELNSIFTNQLIFDSNSFANITLSPAIHQQIQKNPKGEELFRLNLLLFAKAYPSEVAVHSIGTRGGLLWGPITRNLKEIQSGILVVVLFALIAIILIVARFKFTTPRTDPQLTSFWESFPFASLIFFAVAIFMLCDLASSPETSDGEGGSIRLLWKLGLYLVSALVTAIVVLYGAHLVRFEGTVSGLTDKMETVGDSVGKAQGELSRGVEQATKVNAQIDTSANLMKSSGDAFQIQIENCARKMNLIGDAFQVAARIREIRLGSETLEKKQPALKPLSDTVEFMLQEMEDFEDVSLHPLLFPDTKPPTDERDTIFEIGHSLTLATQEAESCGPHYAYMFAALGREFEAERLERYFPGVLLNVAGFAYYVRTVQKIVESLAPWRKDFDFYTLMPESPLEVFRYANSTDFEEWMKFLVAYNQFQREPREGAWHRYFAFRPQEPLTKGMPSFHKARPICVSLKEASVLCDEKPKPREEWKPRLVTKEKWQQLKQSLQEKLGDARMERFQEINRISGDGGQFEGGSLVFPDTRDTLEGCRPLRDVLLEYHGHQQGLDSAEAEKNFTFRCVDGGLAKIIESEIEIESRPIPMKGKKEQEVNRKRIKLPWDLFAIRRKKDQKWVFLIGRDTRTFQTRQGPEEADALDQPAPAHSAFAFMPVIDLVTLGRSGDINSRSAAEIQSKLNAIFVDVDKEKAFNLTQFETKFPI